MRRLSLSPSTVLPCGPLEQIAAAVEAGFESAGLRIVPSLPTDIDVMADRDLQRAIRQKVAATGIRIFDIEVIRVAPRMDLSSVERLLDFASTLGAEWLASTSLALADYRAEDEPSLVERLGELGDLTAKFGMGLMLEFMAFRGLRTIGDAARVISASDTSNVRITLDALHFFRSGGSVDDLKSVDPEAVACVQLCDGPSEAPSDLVAEARQGRLFPGEGQLPLRELLAELPADLPVSVEVPSQSRSDLAPAARARLAAEWAHRLLGGPER